MRTRLLMLAGRHCELAAACRGQRAQSPAYQQLGTKWRLGGSTTPSAQGFAARLDEAPEPDGREAGRERKQQVHDQQRRQQRPARRRRQEPCARTGRPDCVTLCRLSMLLALRCAALKEAPTGCMIIPKNLSLATGAVLG